MTAGINAMSQHGTTLPKFSSGAVITVSREKKKTNTAFAVSALQVGKWSDQSL
jgi:hypothetical protein